MRTIKSVCLLATMILFVTACSQSNFSGESGNAVRTGNSVPQKPPCTGPSCDPAPPIAPPPPGPTPPDGLTPDNGGTTAIVETGLTLIRNPDVAKWQDCLFVNIVGQAPTDLGCNRPFAYSPTKITDATPRLVKVQTNTCNVLHVALKTSKANGTPVTDNVNTASNPNRFRTTKTGPYEFNVIANDNGDAQWNDLNVTIKGDGKIKFTIEGSNIPCDP